MLDELLHKIVRPLNASKTNVSFAAFAAKAAAARTK